MQAAMEKAIKTMPAALFKTLTWDRGKEMARHADIKISTGVQVYFCDPHSPWQRGSNENTNGLLRQFLPKGTDLSSHSAKDLARIAALLNGRPRKTLGYLKPSEKLAERRRDARLNPPSERSALCQPLDPRRHVTERSHRHLGDVQKRKGPRHGPGQRQARSGLWALDPTALGGHRSRVRIGGLNAPAALSFWVAWVATTQARTGPSALHVAQTPTGAPKDPRGAAPLLHRAGTGHRRRTMERPLPRPELCGAGVPAASPHPVRASTPTAANIESGTAMAPRPLALAIDGRAPERRAAFSHRSQANEPVTNRLGPRLSPIKRAKG